MEPGCLQIRADLGFAAFRGQPRRRSPRHKQELIPVAYWRLVPATLPAMPKLSPDLHCRPGAPRLSADELAELKAEVPAWTLVENGERLAREFRFANFKQTMAFVNALAELADTEDHHPDFEVGYGRVHVTFSTHDAGGLTLNDFICAARTDALPRP